MDALQYAMNHIFLPPKLPQEQEPDLEACDIALCRLAYEAAVQFPQYLATYHQAHWAVVIKMLENLLYSTESFGKEYHVAKIMQLGVGGQFSQAWRDLPLPYLFGLYRGPCFSHSRTERRPPAEKELRIYHF